MVVGFPINRTLTPKFYARERCVLKCYVTSSVLSIVILLMKIQLTVIA